MKLIILLSVLLAAYCATIEPETEVVTASDTITFSESYTETPKPIQYKGDITCVCDGKTVVRKLKGNNLENVFNRITTPDYCNPAATFPICELVRRCSSCKAQIRWCKPRPPGTLDNGYDFCHSKSQTVPTYASQNETDPVAAIEIVAMKYRKRLRRQAGFYIPACSYPTRLSNSDMTCVKFEKYVKCVQDCIFGHTLEKTARKIVKCYFNENKWVPEGGFKDCEPYMHCKLDLISHGHMKCSTSTVRIPAYCNVTCGAYEDHKETPLKAYFCTEDGWSDPLPHCVQSGVGPIELVPRPVKPRQQDRDVPIPQITHSFTKSTEQPRSPNRKPSKNEPVNSHPSDPKKSSAPKKKPIDLDEGISKRVDHTPYNTRLPRSIDFSEDIQDNGMDVLASKRKYENLWTGLHHMRQLV